MTSDSEGIEGTMRTAGVAYKDGMGYVWDAIPRTYNDGPVYRTPCHGRLYDALPEESRTARVRLLQPKGGSDGSRDCVVHLAGTGDHGFERRMNLGFPLIAKVPWHASDALTTAILPALRTSKQYKCPLTFNPFRDTITPLFL
jgi:hypothetical protein